MGLENETEYLAPNKPWVMFFLHSSLKYVWKHNLANLLQEDIRKSWIQIMGGEKARHFLLHFLFIFIWMENNFHKVCKAAQGICHSCIADKPFCVIIDRLIFQTSTFQINNNLP